MELVKASAEIVGIYPTQLEAIEMAGRICYQSEPHGEPEHFVQKIIASGHESVIEHSAMSVRFIVDRGVSHELVRHRLASFSQESTRYCDYAGGHIKFVIPSWLEDDLDEGIVGRYDHLPDPVATWLCSMSCAEQDYRDLRRFGWTPQQSRSVLPNALKTELVMTANFREWRHIFGVRDSPKAHPDMRHIMKKLHEAARERLPVIFGGSK